HADAGKDWRCGWGEKSFRARFPDRLRPCHLKMIQSAAGYRDAAREAFLGRVCVTLLVRLAGCRVKSGVSATPEEDEALARVLANFEADQTGYERVFPNGMPRTRAAPCLAGFVIGPVARCNPREKLEHRSAQFICHDAPLLSPVFSRFSRLLKAEPHDTG